MQRVGISLGQHYFGLGFATATTLTSLVGQFLLDRKLKNLEYETFMLRP